ncbi:nucleotidyltransferase domain-containing protein [Pontiella sulfatireligans]|uniref:Polymerase nucleotidyl transferase domain-containing protein n=1 Tax=Pontiella sulfatireligans TaxID=2750658 RepID=A0A6C2UQL4_9BACT|nr:nucleotidyltransferase [Pontiella sulfatireligans]VGO21561.1 hypothetical protein SCARR_03635 [Pontiella sulfatireligans]
MSRDWESIFTTWSQGPSTTEQQRAENAERQIRQAIQASEKLKNRNIKVFTQGSYRNRVNVRKDSDVDVGVLCFDTYFPEYPDDNVKAQLSESFVPATYEYATFKNELEEALVARFGRVAVTRGSKAFDIKANTYRVEPPTNNQLYTLPAPWSCEADTEEELNQMLNQYFDKMR